MKITKKEDFALIFMALLAKQYPERYLSLSRAAKQANIPPFFLKHIGSALRSFGLIESKEGVNGGYRLTKNPKDISVAEILSVFSLNLFTPSCFNHLCRMKKEKCLSFSLWHKASQQIYAYLEKVSLKQLTQL